MRRMDLAVVIVIGAASVALLHAARPSIAQDTNARAEAPRLGVVDVLSLVEQMLQLEQYASVREERADYLSAEIEKIQTEMGVLSQQLNNMQPGDPAGQQVYNQLQMQRQNAQMFQEQSLADFQRLSAGQATEVYAAVRGAVDAVAAREGYTYVLASREGGDLTGATTLPAITQEVLARPMLVGFERSDLTEMVRNELELPDPAEMPADAAPGEDADAGDAAETPAEDAQAEPEDEGGEAP